MHNKVFFNNSKWEKLAWDFFVWGLFSKYAVLMCHDNNSSKETRLYKKLSATFIESQIAYLKFDFSWFGESEWNPSDLNSAKWKNDVVAAVEYLKSQWIDKIIVLWEWVGAIYALRAALWNTEIAWLVLVSPWSQDENFIELFDITSWYDKPIFILHWGEDKIVDVTNIDKLAKWMKNATVEVIRWADHDFSNDREYIKMYNLVAEYLFNIYNNLNK